MKPDTPALLTLLVATLLFGLGIALRSQFNPWLLNLFAGLVSCLLAVAVLRKGLPQLIEVRRNAALGAVALGAVMVALTHLGYRGMVVAVPALQGVVEGLYEDIRLTAPPMALMVPLIGFIVVAEELIWRGVAFQFLESRLSKVQVVVASTLLYALPQVIGGAWLLLVTAIFVGGVFSVQRAMSGRMTEAILTHATWSISIFGVLPLY